MTEPVELMLSASSMKNYLRCPRRYYLSSVLRVPESQNVAAAIGTAVHAAIETALSPFALSSPQDALERSLAAEMALVPPAALADAEDPSPDAHKLLALWRKNIAPTLGQIRLVERDFLLRITGVLITGRIDFGDQDVHDTKTTSALSKFHPEAHQLQLTIYRHGYKAITGSWPGRLILDVIARNGRWKQVDLEPDDDGLIEIVGVVRDGIMAERFEPSGALTGACTWCPYSSGVCSFAVLTPVISLPPDLLEDEA